MRLSVPSQPEHFFRSSISCSSSSQGPTCCTMPRSSTTARSEERERQLQVMVDDDDRDSCRSLSKASNSSSTIDGAKALERLVQQQDARVARSARATAPSAARRPRVVGRRVPALLDAREEGEDLVLAPVDAGPRVMRLRLQSSMFSFTLMPAKRRAPAARRRRRAAVMREEGCPASSSPASVIEPEGAGRCRRASSAASTCGTPLRPSRATISFCLTSRTKHP